jgi:hypothetical protein
MSLFQNLVPPLAGLEIIWDLEFGYWDFPANAGLVLAERPEEIDRLENLIDLKGLADD